MNLSVLMKIPLFHGIAENRIGEILSELNIKDTYIKKGEILAFQDEPCNRLIILLSGSVKAEMADPSGKVIKIEDIYAPSPLAILFLFGTDNKFPVQATAREDIAALVIPRQSVIKMLSMDEVLLKNYLDISADFASRLSQKLHFLSFRTIRQKISMYLLNLLKNSQTDTDAIELDKTKSALADYFGVSRQSLERELTNMQHDGLILSEKKKIIIRDKGKLIQIVRFG